MLVFLDETFRTNTKTGAKLAALCGIGVPEEVFPDFLEGIHQMRRPYHGTVLGEDDEIKGKLLLNKPVLDARDKTGHSTKWSLCEDLLNFTWSKRIKVFGLVTFNPSATSLVHDDERALHSGFRKLFNRIDRYMKLEHPGGFAKLIFDSRQDKENERNSRAITRFFTRSTLGNSFDSIVKVPFFGVSQAHNYGLQVADLVTTVIGLRFASESRVAPLWSIIRERMLYRMALGDRQVSSLAVEKQGEGLAAHENEPGDR